MLLFIYCYLLNLTLKTQIKAGGEGRVSMTKAPNKESNPKHTYHHLLLESPTYIYQAASCKGKLDIIKTGEQKYIR